MKRIFKCGVTGRFPALVLILAAAFFFALGMTPAGAWTYEELVELYGKKERAMPEAGELKEALLSEAGDLDGLGLWRSIVGSSTPHRQRAADSLKLIEILFPRGDTSRWEDVSGFWYPALIPKPLAAFDAVYYAVMGLLELDEEGAPWLARELMAGLRRSSRAAHIAMREAPVEYASIVARLDELTGLSPMGGWPAGELVGNLPFARPVRFSVSADWALAMGMTFLDNSGVPASGMGPYAWDRKKGAIYRVTDGLDDDVWWWR
ncbi:MAG: Uncharacterized protein XE12_1603 [Synergistales bacterium 54_9]|nr:MAG: Uncharacterized protein XE12_1603 [Synergistales bacterium 54_9]